MKKVLVIRFSSIGDIVLTTPVVRCLKKQTGARIHFLTKQNYQSILESNPYIDRIFSIHEKVKEILPALKEENYDAIIDLHKNIRSFQVKRALQTKSYTFDKINRQKWWMVNFKRDVLPRVHIVDRYMAAVNPLGVQYDGAGLDYFIPMEEVVNIPQLLNPKNFQSEKALSSEPFSFVAIAIGAAHATKRMPTHKLIELCRQITQPVVLLGGPDDKTVGAEIAMKVGAHVFNGCGKFSVHQSASIIQQATKVITHDTGMMHIAAALKREILSIWGNTIPEFGMYPFYPDGISINTTFEVNKLKCRPCSKIGFSKCPKGHFRCMQDIPVNEIARQV